MRRTWLALALLGAATSLGCKGSVSPGAGALPGGGDGTFAVTVQNGQNGNTPLAIRGGYVTSTPAGIDCGVAPHSLCTASFPKNTQVVLTATAVGDDASYTPPKPFLFIGWAGDCTGVAGCTLGGNADKYVVAMFDGERRLHPNFTDGKVHGPAYAARATNGLDCFGCHGDRLQGAGIAIDCDGCHRTPSIPAAAKPTLAFQPDPSLTGTAGEAVTLSALATDPAGAQVTCTWSLAAKPAGSAAALAVTGPCDGTPGAASFTPDVAGAYKVRVSATNQAPAIETPVLVAAQAFGGGDVASTPDVAPNAELAAIAARLDAVLTIAKNTITADALATRLMNPKNVAQTPISVVDVRDPADFAKGHIPGAINVPLAQLPSVLLADPGYLPATELAIASYNGGDGNMATLLINAVRYNGTSIPGFALGIMGGMSAWSLDRELTPTRFDDDLAAGRRIENGATEKTASAPTGPTYAYPAVGAFTASVDDVSKKILVRAREYLKGLEAEAAAAGVPHREAFWTTFPRYQALEGTAAEPQVLSVRSAADYNTRGHVPGAINVPWGAVAKLATQTKLVDPARKVFVYCYTGHTGGQATMALGILGYQSRNLLYGINGWSGSAAVVSVSLQKFDATRAFDFPQHDWPDAPASLVGWAPPRAGCQACHESQTAQWFDLTVKPVAVAAAQPASEGEG